MQSSTALTGYLREAVWCCSECVKSDLSIDALQHLGAKVQPATQASTPSRLHPGKLPGAKNEQYVRSTQELEAQTVCTYGTVEQQPAKLSTVQTGARQTNLSAAASSFLLQSSAFTQSIRYWIIGQPTQHPAQSPFLPWPTSAQLTCLFSTPCGSLNHTLHPTSTGPAATNYLTTSEAPRVS